MIEKERTYFKNFHRGYSKPKGGMTEGDVREKLGCITVKVFGSSLEFFSVRDLKEVLGGCGFYLTERIIRRMTSEGGLRGRKWNELDTGMWYYTKRDIYAWVGYLVAVGDGLLRGRGVIKEEKDLDMLIRSREKKKSGQRKRESVLSL